jgi:hypothetical protein
MMALDQRADCKAADGADVPAECERYRSEMTDLPPPGCPAVRSGHFPLLINSALLSPQAVQGASISYNSVGLSSYRWLGRSRIVIKEGACVRIYSPAKCGQRIDPKSTR